MDNGLSLRLTVSVSFRVKVMQAYRIRVKVSCRVSASLRIGEKPGIADPRV